MRSSSQPSQCAGMICQGWISLAAWIVFGLLMEGLIGFRSPALLDDSVRRDMFRLAHAHGTLLNLVLIAAAICARLDLIRIGTSNIAGIACGRSAVAGRLPICRYMAFQRRSWRGYCPCPD